MSQPQLNSDPWTNLTQLPSGKGNAYAVARAQADVSARAVHIIRARALLEEAMAALATPVLPFLFEVTRSLLAKNGDYFNDDSDAIAFSVIMNIFLLIDVVLCSKTTTVL